MRKAFGFLLRTLSLVFGLFALFGAVIITTDLIGRNFEEEEEE